MSSSVLETLSNEFAAAAEAVGGSVVAIYGRRWMPSSGIQWRKGVIVTANHTIRRQEDITVSAAGGQSSKATLAGRDPSTDLAILKVGEDTVLPVPQVAEEVKLGHFVLALGRSRGANLVASAGVIGGLSGEWQPQPTHPPRPRTLSGILRRSIGQRARQGGRHQHERPGAWTRRHDSHRHRKSSCGRAA